MINFINKEHRKATPNGADIRLYRLSRRSFYHPLALGEASFQDDHRGLKSGKRKSFDCNFRESGEHVNQPLAGSFL
jgi:hypothetical protein